jgi:hypothetical protein
MKKYYFSILLLLFIILLFTFFPFKEGFEFGSSNSSIGEYSYLEPVPKGNTWDNSIKEQILVAINKNNKKNNPNSYPATMDILSNYFNIVIPECTSEEAQYYINNGNYPYCTYITDYMNKNYTKNNPENIINTWSKLIPNRSIYSLGIAQTEEKESPQPLSYQIYMGTAKPPQPSITQEIETTIENAL